MHKSENKMLVILRCLGLVWLLGTSVSFGAAGDVAEAPVQGIGMPILMALQGPGAKLERPAVPFDHDLHTRSLKQTKIEDCSVCHVLKATDRSQAGPEVKVFRFPKKSLKDEDTTSSMNAYHSECVNCHRTMSAQGKKTGPDIGLCGKCHIKKPQVKKVAWAWSPIFNYARHAKHVESLGKRGGLHGLNVVDKIDVPGNLAADKKTCCLCHHSYDEKNKLLVYKTDTENSCRACHKDKDENNARSMNKVAHAACVSCHIKLSQEHKDATPRTAPPAEPSKSKTGPFECKGCHGEHKDLAPDELLKIPRLVRGQKDMLDLSLVMADQTSLPAAEKVAASAATRPVRMKIVPFNHKAHEARGQFCNTCHHHSLEKCVNCHNPAGDSKKGGQISYERAFHKPGSRQACLGCHETAKQDKKCAGCHQSMPNSASASSCAVCHRGPSGGKPVEISPTPLVVDKEKVPEKVQIKALEKEFKPAELPHLKIVNNLITLSNNSSLARWFHSAREQAICAGCHHRSDLQQAAVTVPKCGSCHGKSFDPSDLGKPGLTAAYHRQCIGCHQGMNQKPTALECAKCHQAKEGLKTVGLIPNLSAPE